MKPCFPVCNVVAHQLLFSPWFMSHRVTDLAVFFYQQSGSVCVVHVCSIAVSVSPHPHPRRGNASLESVLLATWCWRSFWTNHQTDVLIFSSLFFHCPSLWVLLSPFPMILTQHVICDGCIFHGCYYAPSLPHLPLARCQTSQNLLNPHPPPHPHPFLKKKKKCSVPINVTIRPLRKKRKKEKKTLFQRVSSSSLRFPLLPWTPGAHIAHRKLVQVLLIFSQLFFFYIPPSFSLHTQTLSRTAIKTIPKSLWQGHEGDILVSRLKLCKRSNRHARLFLLLRLILREFKECWVKGEAAFIGQLFLCTQRHFYYFSHYGLNQRVIFHFFCLPSKQFKANTPSYFCSFNKTLNHFYKQLLSYVSCQFP